MKVGTGARVAEGDPGLRSTLGKAGNKSCFSHPKSASFRPSDDVKKTNFAFFGGLLAGPETKEVRQAKQRQYYEDLSRQVQEKLQAKHALAGTQGKHCGAGESSCFHKKLDYESSLSINGCSLFSGLLQRDEVALIRKKKQEQQREIKEALSRQIEEKKTSKSCQLEKKYTEKREILPKNAPKIEGNGQKLTLFNAKLVEMHPKRDNFQSKQQEQGQFLVSFQSPGNVGGFPMRKSELSLVEREGEGRADRGNLDAGGESKFLYPQDEGELYAKEVKLRKSTDKSGEEGICSPGGLRSPSLKLSRFPRHVFSSRKSP